MRDRGGNIKQIAEWLASVNLSQQETWQFPLKTLPRPTGKSTKVIFTEYDLPDPRIQPHDVMMDSEGNVWYSDFGQMILGKMDPKTGKVTQYPIPVVKPGWPVGSLDLEIDQRRQHLDRRDVPGGDRAFDQKTEKFEMWSIPKEWDTDGAPVRPSGRDRHACRRQGLGEEFRRHQHLPARSRHEQDGRISARRRIRATTSGSAPMACMPTRENNVYLLDFSAGNIVKIDAKTKKPTVYLTPTPDSRPRRGRVDHEGRVWFAEYQAERIGMFDPKTGAMKEWKVPTPWSAPYDAVAGKTARPGPARC